MSHDALRVLLSIFSEVEVCGSYRCELWGGRDSKIQGVGTTREKGHPDQQQLSWLQV
jgi:hypothetical protein